MNKITITTILTVTALVAGVFAFLPVQEATTVHNTILASTTQISTVAFNSLAVDSANDYLITCPTGSAGCRVLEAYIKDNDTNAADDVDIDLIDLRMNGETVNLAADVDNPATDDITRVIAGVSGIAMTADDVITVALTGLSDNTVLIVVAETEGDSEIGVTAPT